MGIDPNGWSSGLECCGEREVTDWDAISDDEFVEEAQRRVNLGHWSPDRYMSQLQSDDRAKLGILRSAIVSAYIRNPTDPVLSALHSKCDELDSIYGNPLPARAYAVNTSLFGREDRFETHQEEM